jgi:hypothetical protein
MTRKTALLALASLVMAASAVASITFDPNSGTGFVGKGDVQSTCGWNNAGLQSHASGVGFSYQVHEVWAVTCEHETAKKTITQGFDRQRNINSSIAMSARSHNQVDGFNLNGYSSNGGNPAVSCPGDPGDPNAAWTMVGEPVLVSSSGGGFAINCGS